MRLASLAATTTVMAALFAAIVTPTQSGCAEATGDVGGGATRFDPRAEEEGTAPEGEDDEDEVDAGSYPEDAIDAGTGTTWTAIYRDLFAPNVPSSCAGNQTGCHKTADESGVRNSKGFLCDNAENCRKTLISSEAIGEADIAKPKSSKLYRVLRHRSGGRVVGGMPKVPADYVFSRASTKRVTTWIANGFPND